jgi:3-oxoacyl-[acyl-carrier protein] reductase
MVRGGTGRTLLGKTALVTGASRGIGEGIARKFREEGAKVLAPARNEMDLSTPEAIDAFLSRLDVPVDILVNNAGINIPGNLQEISEPDLRETFRCNLDAPIRLAQGLAPGMKERRYGRIVNISSVWSVVCRDSRLAYTASKAALNGVTRALAIELAPSGILVNAVAPGYVDTEMTRRNNTPQEIERVRARIPLGRLSRPEEIAELVAFLASERNSCVTGQVIVADGGYTCL